MSQVQLNCIGCSRLFATDNLPRTAKCLHTYCERCLKTLTQCVLDQSPIDNTIPVSSYAINMTVAKSITRVQVPSASYSSALNSLPQSTRVPTYTPSQQFIPSSPKMLSVQHIPLPQVNNLPAVVVTPPPTFVPSTESTHDQINPERPQKQMCLLHNKQIDLVCVDDGVAICSNCALFGQHRPHNIKTIDNAMAECKEISKQATDLLDQLGKVDGSVSMRSIEQRIELSSRERKHQLGAQVRGHYSNLIDKLREAEEQSLVEIDSLIGEFKTALREDLGKQCKEDKKKQWMDQANLLIKGIGHMGKRKIEEACQFIRSGESEEGFIKRGEYLVVELNTLAKLSQQKINGCFNHVSLQLQDINIGKLAKSSCRISKDLLIDIQPRWMSNHKGDQDILLQDVYVPQSSQRVHTFSIDNGSEFSLNSRLNSENNSNLKSDREKGDKQPFSVCNGQTRKKKKIKVPEKFEQVVEDLRHDRSECIDFTNAELGDASIIPIFQLLRTTTRVKTLKLIRNKLTDDCLVRLLQCCLDCKVSTINLSQNSLSDQAIDILEIAEYRQLRSMTLTQNRINQRHAKPRVQELKKIGLNVFL